MAALQLLLLLLLAGPAHADAEQDRIREHLRGAWAQIESTAPPAPGDAERRALQLERLAGYIEAGQFPRNPGAQLQSVFIDDRGVACAVAHLLISDGQSALARSVDAQFHTARLVQMDDPDLLRWAASSGLRLSELARIQPSYAPEPDLQPFLAAIRADDLTALEESWRVVNNKPGPQPFWSFEPQRALDDALGVAAKAGSVESVRWLLAESASPRRAPLQSALEAARSAGHQPVVDLLEKALAGLSPTAPARHPTDRFPPPAPAAESAPAAEPLPAPPAAVVAPSPTDPPTPPPAASGCAGCSVAVLLLLPGWRRSVHSVRG